MWRSSELARLRELEQHQELSLDLIATASFDGFFTRVNPAFTRTLGWTAEELLSRPLLEFVHPDDRDPTMKAIADQTLAGQEIFNFQNRYLTKDGSYRWLEWTSRPDPHAKALIAVARDITDRKLLEEQLGEHQRLLEEAVAERTAELALRTTALEEAENETLMRLALAAEFRDERAAEHNARVARTAELLAHKLGQTAEQAKLIGQAAVLHDVGKIAVPDTLLLKPGPLTTEEFDLVKQHTTAGAAILKDSQSPVLKLAAEIARSHHEWWNGTGYPAGLLQEEIPLPARIVAIADVFDAITHARSYKPPWPIEHAHEEIHKLRGLQFDPNVVDAFQQLDARRLADTPRRPRLTAVA